ncbi:AEC family transporter [Candidatus Uhrbacteria bacterium]|nr:AEC family transporter [Candidatus Uhrbacteria bacterium]
MLSSLLAIIVPTFGIGAVGWFCRQRGIFNGAAVHGLNAYAYYIALPALIFESVFRQAVTASFPTGDLRYLLGLAVAHILVLVIGTIALRWSRREVRAAGPMLLTFGSTAYLGIPFATFAFGEAGTAYAALGSVMLVVVMLFASLVTLNRHGRRETPVATWRQLLELPFLWVVLIGALLPLVGIRSIPEFLSRTIGILSGSAGPTALLALGAFQYGLKLDRIPWGWASVLGVGKVALCAIATYLVLILMGVSGLPLAVGTALAATSVAVTAFVLADEYRIGRELTAGALVASTPASLAALTLISWLWLGTNLFR